MTKACIDSGVLVHIFDDKSSQDISRLLKEIKDGTTSASILSPILCEVYFHLCRAKGREYASTKIVAMLDLFPLEIIHVNTPLIIKAGQLKCQNQKLLSYNDCLSIAYCMLNKVPFHTTEKKLKEMPNGVQQQLKVVKYAWD